MRCAQCFPLLIDSISIISDLLFLQSDNRRCAPGGSFPNLESRESPGGSCSILDETVAAPEKLSYKKSVFKKKSNSSSVNVSNLSMTYCKRALIEYNVFTAWSFRVAACRTGRRRCSCWWRQRRRERRRLPADDGARQPRRVLVPAPPAHAAAADLLLCGLVGSLPCWR